MQPSDSAGGMKERRGKGKRWEVKVMFRISVSPNLIVGEWADWMYGTNRSSNNFHALPDDGGLQPRAASIMYGAADVCEPSMLGFHHFAASLRKLRYRGHESGRATLILLRGYARYDLMEVPAIAARGHDQAPAPCMWASRRLLSYVAALSGLPHLRPLRSHRIAKPSCIRLDDIREHNRKADSY